MHISCFLPGASLIPQCDGLIPAGLYLVLTHVQPESVREFAAQETTTDSWRHKLMVNAYPAWPTEEQV